MARTVILGKITQGDFGYESSLGGGASSYKALPGKIDDFNSPDISADEIRYGEVENQNYRVGSLHGMRTYRFTLKLTLQSMEALYWALGTDTFSDPNHTLSFNNTLPSMEFRFKYANNYGHVFKGCKLKSFKMSIAEKSKVVVDLTFEAMSHTYADMSSVTLTTSSTVTPFLFADITSMAMNSVEYDEQVRSIELVIDRGVEALAGVTSKNPLYVIEGKRKTEFSVELYAPSDDSTLYALFNSETEFAVTFSMQNTDGHTVSMSIAKARFFSYQHNNNDKAITVPLTVVCIGDWTATVNDGTTAAYN